MDESNVKKRNAVRYVNSSPFTKAKFKMCVYKERIESKSLLCLDVPTRWNSTYMMLEVAENFEKAFQRVEEDGPHFLCYFVDEECDGYDDDDYYHFDDGNGVGREKGKGRRRILGPPDTLDWSKTRAFVEFLKIFYSATLRFSGSLYITSNSFFHEVVFIQNKLRQLMKNDDYFVSSMAKNLIGKFDKYWSLEKVNMLLYIAVVLDPRFKLKYVAYWFGQLCDNGVANDMSRKVKDTLIRLYEWYGDNNSPSSSSSRNVNQTSHRVCRNAMDEDDDIDGHDFLVSQFKKHLEAKDSVGAKSEVQRYLAESCEDDIPNFDVFNWWKINSAKYRVLSHVARDLLAIPVSTVAPESAFSMGRRVLDPFHSSLSPKTMEALICANDWIRSSSSPINPREAMDEVEKLAKIEEDN